MVKWVRNWAEMGRIHLWRYENWHSFRNSSRSAPALSVMRPFSSFSRSSKIQFDCILRPGSLLMCFTTARLTDTVWLGWTSTALWQDKKNVRFLIKRNNWTSGYSDLVTKKSSATLIYGLIRMSPYKKGRVWWNHNYVFIFLTDSVKYLKPNMTQIPVWRGLPNQWWWSKKSKTHLKLTNSTLGSF